MYSNETTITSLSHAVPSLPTPCLAEFGPCRISATSRQDSHLEKLKELGYKPVKASLDDRDLIVKLVSEHDVVINTASSDHPESVQSTLDGIQKRIDAGKQTVYLHTSVRTSASYAFTTPT
jgi:saccharopine dehydrogenase-like NADP-dependent oxidoreductase